MLDFNWNDLVEGYNVSGILDAFKEFFNSFKIWLEELLAAWETFGL